MRYLMQAPTDRAALLAELERMPEFLEAAFARLTSDEATVPGPGDTFGPVAQCWHLADLEREGYGTRIRRLLEEAEPRLPDFDGARIARERDYASRSLAAGLAAFRAARRANVSALRAIEADAWMRGGTQEGVGPIMLCDVPAMMAEHDAAHREEIRAWQAARDPRRSAD
jgi:hypothetical protein